MFTYLKSKPTVHCCALALLMLLGCAHRPIAIKSHVPPCLQCLARSANLSCTGQGFDTYCGISSLNAAGGATGYFYVEKDTTTHGVKQWVLADPLGHLFPFLSVYNYSEDNGNFATRYGAMPNPSAAFATHELNRTLQLGFNAVDIYSVEYAWPVNNSASGPAAVQLPFMVFLPTANDATGHPSYFGWTDNGLKNLCDGQNGHGFHGSYCPTGSNNSAIDPFDPRWTAANQTEIAFQFTGPGVGGGPPIFAGTTIKTNPWPVGITLGDPDWWFMARGQGSSPNGSTGYPLPSQVVATSAYDFTASPVNETWQNKYLYAKLAWTCGNYNGTSGDGSSYLETTYGSIAALKAAWGSCANSYTTFCSSHPGGGFGTGGTGLLDEDGSGACFGSGSGDYFLQSNIPAAVVTDLNAFLYKFAYQLYRPQVQAIRNTYGDTNHLLFCGNVGGVGAVGIRSQVAQAMKDAGCSVIIMQWDSTYISQAQNGNGATYAITGLPETIWYAVSGNHDSDMNSLCGRCDGTCGVFDGDFCTQAARGTHYGSDLSTMYSTTAANGDRYIMGTAFWSLFDKTGEQVNFGWSSVDLDNLYDGQQATITGNGNDQWGYSSGGEAANYGNFFTSVKAANAAWVTSLISDAPH